MVPSLSKAGFSAASDSAVVPGRTPSSTSTRSGSPLRWGTCTGTISSARRPSLAAAAAFSWLAAAKASWRSREIADLLVVLLGGQAHGDVVEGIGQAVVHHGVDQRAVADAVAGTGAGEQVGRLGHRLHPAGHHDLGVTGPDHLVGQVDGVAAPRGTPC